MIDISSEDEKQLLTLTKKLSVENDANYNFKKSFMNEVIKPYVVKNKITYKTISQQIGLSFADVNESFYTYISKKWNGKDKNKLHPVNRRTMNYYYVNKLMDYLGFSSNFRSDVLILWLKRTDTAKSKMTINNKKHKSILDKIIITAVLRIDKIDDNKLQMILNSIASV